MSEVVRVMSSDEARSRVARVRAHVEQAWDDLIALHAGRGWFALGYDSWDALCDAEFDGARIALPREDRREVVGQMREAGMSTRAIASAVGVSVGTIVSDLNRSEVNSPDTITGLDGRTRPAKVTTTSRTTEATKVEQMVDTETGEVLDTPAPVERATPRKPLTDQFFDAAYDLSKVTERIARLASDDRFPQNAEKVAAKYRNDLIRAIDALQGVLNRLPAA